MPLSSRTSLYSDGEIFNDVYDEANHAFRTSGGSGGGGGGTQYADGATAATPTGTAVVWNDGGTARVASATKPLPVATAPLAAATDSVSISAPTRLTLQATTTQTASGNSAAQSVGPYREALAFLNVTAASGTTPTLTVRLQTSDDGGTTWYDLPGAAFTQATIATSQALALTTFGDTIRAAWVVGDTTPSFTFAIKLVLK